MLFDTTHIDSDTLREISSLVGPPYPLHSRLKFGGVDSGQTLVEEASEIISSHLPYETPDLICHLELRPTGILAYFHFKVRDLVWVVPYRKSALYQSNAGLKIYCDTDFIRIGNLKRGSIQQRFIRKMMIHRATYLDTLSMPR